VDSPVKVEKPIPETFSQVLMVERIPGVIFSETLPGQSEIVEGNRLVHMMSHVKLSPNWTKKYCTYRGTFNVNAVVKVILTRDRLFSMAQVFVCHGQSSHPI
jgi:hypothetical protein